MVRLAWAAARPPIVGTSIGRLGPMLLFPMPARAHRLGYRVDVLAHAHTPVAPVGECSLAVGGSQRLLYLPGHDWYRHAPNSPAPAAPRPTLPQLRPARRRAS